MRLTCFDKPLQGDCFCIGFFAIMGIAGAGNIAGAALKLSFGRLCIISAVIYALVFVCASLVFLTERKKNSSLPSAADSFGKNDRRVNMVIFAAGLVFLLLFVITQVTPAVYLAEDITLETVRTFLSSDRFYEVNPLTGAPYTAGIPNRLKILGLPFFYAFLAKIFPLTDAGVVVWRMMPGLVLVMTVCAYYSLSAALFKEKRSRAIFMLIAGIVLFLSDYVSGADGFALLQAGFRGVSIRALVLMPYTLSLLLRKKWIYCILPVLVEAVTVWTLYGAGAVLLMCVMFYAFEGFLKG